MAKQRVSMASFDQGSLERVNREIIDLQRRIADEAKKEADATKRSSDAQAQALRSSSASTAKSYLSTAQRYSNDAQRARERRADYSTKLARRTEEASRLQQRINKADMDARRKEAEDRKREVAANQKRQRDAERRIQELESQLAERIATGVPLGNLVAEGESETYDVFISHASEYKADFVAELAAAAREKGLKVWYDEFSLSWGDKLRRSIDRGLSGAYFGVVVLSENFFRKEWPQIELDALLEKEVSGTGRILPIWHKVTRDEIMKYVPTLSGTLALRSSDSTIEEIAERLCEMVTKVRRERAEIQMNGD